jgi:hypothetical protein
MVIKMPARKPRFKTITIVGKAKKPKPKERVHIQRGVDIDLAQMGFGKSGHGAYHEPGMPLGIREPYMFVGKLDKRTHEQYGWGKGAKKSAISASMSTLMAAKHIILTAPERIKADALKRMLLGPINNKCPISVTLLHNNVDIVVTRASARKILDPKTLAKIRKRLPEGVRLHIASGTEEGGKLSADLGTKTLAEAVKKRGFFTLMAAAARSQRRAQAYYPYYMRRLGITPKQGRGTHMDEVCGTHSFVGDLSWRRDGKGQGRVIGRIVHPDNFYTINGFGKPEDEIRSANEALKNLANPKFILGRHLR